MSNLEGITLSERFRLERQLGRGGYGSVYEAEQLSVGRMCAVKVLSPKAGHDTTTEERFSQEARTTSQLTHPNSIVIYDFGRDKQRELLWLAMELLDGETLQSRVQREGVLGLDRCLHIVRQVAESLQEAHDIGLVHRDIKPGNIMLLKRGGDPDFVKVIDFGIAKVVRDTLMPSGNMTQTGRILGTPKYMAPEQIRDTSVDGRADMYALATVVYALLTSRVPFSSGTAMEIASRQLTDQPPRIRELVPDLEVGPGFESVLLRALSKNPDRRFDDIIAFADALEDATLSDESDAPRVVDSVESTPQDVDEAAYQEEMNDDIMPTTEQMAGGATPTAEVGYRADLDADDNKGHHDATPSERARDVTLDTVAVSSYHSGSTTSADEVGDGDERSVEPRTLVRIAAVFGVLVFGVAVAIWWGAREEASPRTHSPGQVEEQVEQQDEQRAASESRTAASGKESRGAAGQKVETPPSEQSSDSSPGASDTDQKPRHGARDEAGRRQVSDEQRDSGTAELDGPDGGADSGPTETEKAVAHIRMTVRAIPWGELYIDGRHVGSGAKVNVRVREGAREFTLEQDGEVRARRTVDVSAGSPRIIELVAD